MYRKYESMEARLFANSVLDLATECWVWTGPRDKRPQTAYGKINLWDKARGRTRTRQAHIISYETFIGPVPEGHQLDHKCFNSFCINPMHLDPALPAVNNARKRKSA